MQIKKSTGMPDLSERQILDIVNLIIVYVSLCNCDPFI